MLLTAVHIDDNEVTNERRCILK